MHAILKSICFVLLALASMPLYARSFAEAVIVWERMYFVSEDSATTIDHDVIDETLPEPFYGINDGVKSSQVWAIVGNQERWAETYITEDSNSTYVITSNDYIEARSFNQGFISIGAGGTGAVEIHVPYELYLTGGAAGSSANVRVEVESGSLYLFDSARKDVSGNFQYGELVLSLPEAAKGHTYALRGLTYSQAGPIPEPENVALLGWGLAALGLARRIRLGRARRVREFKPDL